MTWPCPELPSQGPAAGMPPFTSASLTRPEALRCRQCWSLGSPAEAQGWAGRLGSTGGCRRARAGSAAQRVKSRSVHPDPARTRPECVRRGLAALPRLPFISSFLQASERKPLPLLCQSPLLHCNGSLGLPSCTSSPAVPQALPATACCCLQTLQPGLGWEHLSPRNPKAGNFYLPLQRSRSFLSVAACAGLAEASLGHKHPVGLSA